MTSEPENRRIYADDLIKRKDSEIASSIARTLEELGKRVSKLEKYSMLNQIRLLHAPTSKKLKFGEEKDLNTTTDEVQLHNIR